MMLGMGRRRARATGRPRRRRRIAWRPVVAVGLLALGLLLAVAFVGITVQGNALAREIDALRADIAAQQARQAALQAAVTEKQTDAYVIQKARDLDFVQKGEGIIAVQRDATAQSAQPNAVSPGPSRLARWVAFFFGTR